MHEHIAIFFKHQIQIKMFHFQTKKYGAHKASDKYLEKFLDNFDRLMEVCQGINDKLSLTELEIEKMVLYNEQNINEKVNNFVTILYEIKEKYSKHSDLNNILDDMIADAHQFNYLLTFQ